MNFNASRNVNPAGGIRKAKRVSDVAAMGAPSPTPTYAPAPGFNQSSFEQGNLNQGGFDQGGFNQGVFNQGPPPPYQEGIQLDSNAAPNQVPNYNFMAGFAQNQMASPTQIGAMLQQPVVQDMALEYGGRLAQQSKEVVKRELHKFVPVSRLRYYFAVDTRYVIKKLFLILFPFTHKDWMVKFDQDTPVQPRYDINAPDLYIPYMGYVTYVLLAGFMLGLQQRFSPEQIGIQASSALAYIIFEMLLYLVTLYITATSTSLKTLDLLAFSGYKYTTMISSLLAGLLLAKAGYYTVLVYTSFALSYFLVKTLRVQVLSGGGQTEQAPPGYSYGGEFSTPNPYADTWNKPGGGGTKRRLYFLLFVAVTQPALSWWLTYHLLPATIPPILPSS